MAPVSLNKSRSVFRSKWAYLVIHLGFTNSLRAGNRERKRDQGRVEKVWHCTYLAGNYGLNGEVVFIISLQWPSGFAGIWLFCVDLGSLEFWNLSSLSEEPPSRYSIMTLTSLCLLNKRQYLGVLFNSNLQWKYHISCITKISAQSLVLLQV